MKVLIIDNYDSFTFNLYQLTGEVLYEEFSNEINDIIVKINDEVNLAEVKKNNFDKIIISPGPGSPVDDDYFGICKEVIKELGNENVPILGICLGMQGIVHVLGGKIIHAKSPMHGKSSFLIHNEEGIHAEIPQKIEVMRTYVKKLKPRYETLVEMRYFKEMSYEEISTELGLPLGTVKAQLFRAREFLYNLMKHNIETI